MDTFVWAGIALCLSQSAIFSGLNLAMFGLSRLRLETEVESGNRAAAKILALRQDSNFLLTTILWGNVGVNTLLTLLSDSVLAGVGAFLFATIGITIVGEIGPQAYFSRNALVIGALLSPVLRFYQFVLYPVAKPSAKVLDWWLGPEGITYMRERDLRELLRMHARARESDLGRVEGMGALNFLEIDDVSIDDEGEPVDERSIIALPVTVDLPILPAFERKPDDPFLQQVQASGKKWVILTDLSGTPQLVVDADQFLRGALYQEGDFQPYTCCHRPIVIDDPKTKLGRALMRLRVVEPESSEDDVVDRDVILLWGDEKRVITGADLLGRLLRGIVPREGAKRG
ncbi:MAG: DUF21 domain-containing protein [Actinomycetota bacterium]|nr:DUF21 domain-containing protein [Actinomycetota bacterium]